MSAKAFGIPVISRSEMARPSILYAAASVLLLCCGVSSAIAGGQRALHVHVAGFKGPGFSIDIKGAVVRYRSGPSYEEPSLAWHRLKVHEKDVQRLTERLTQLGVFDWQAEYYCPALDGLSWSLEASWGGKRISSHGSNKVPPRFDEVQGVIGDLTLERFGISTKDLQECGE